MVGIGWRLHGFAECNAYFAVRGAICAAGGNSLEEVELATLDRGGDIRVVIKR